MFKSPLGTMHQASILLVCAVMAAASLLVTCHGLFDYRYFDPSLMIENAQEKIKETKSALIKLKPKPTDSPEMIMSRIITAYKFDKLEDKRKFIYGCLMELFDASKTRFHPSIDMVRQVMIILEILKDRSDESFDIFAGFLRHYGWMKFTRSLSTYVDVLEKDLVAHPEAERKLDLVFSVHALKSEADKAERLSKVEWSNGEFKVDDAIRAILTVRELARVGDPYKYFFKYLSDQCKAIRFRRSLVLGAIIIAHALGVDSTRLPPRTKKLKEYIRLCKSWRNKEIVKGLLEQQPRFFI